MKFFQFAKFYDPYLNQFYRERPELHTADYESLLRALLDDAFSCGMLYGNCMQARGYEGRLVIPNFEPAQRAWAYEHGCLGLWDDNWRVRIVKEQIDRFKPDVLFATHSVDEYDSKFIRALSGKPALTIAWRAASISADTDYSEYDLLLSSDPGCRRQGLAQGARSACHFLPGFPIGVSKRLEHVPKEVDISFSGQWTPEHKTQNEYLKAVGKATLGWQGGFSLAYYLAGTPPEQLPAAVAMYNHGARWGLSMFTVLKQARIAINAIKDIAQGGSASIRQFETTGVGTFLLTEYHDSLREFFEPGQEIETFRSEGEQLEKIRYYLDHPEQRDAIAARGQARCHTAHSMEARMAWFDEIVKEALKNKCLP